jgi:hypothetical protein
MGSSSHTFEVHHGASRNTEVVSQVSLKKASCSRHLVSKSVASLSCSVALVSFLMTVVCVLRVQRVEMD